MSDCTKGLRMMRHQRRKDKQRLWSNSSVALVLLLMLGIRNCVATSSSGQLQQGRKMLQAAPAAVPASPVSSPAPQVQATSGPVSEKLQELASMLAAAKASKHQTPTPAPAATIVVPAPQTAAVPTTIGGPLSLSTSTPVRVASPVNVSTPVQQKSVQLGQHHSVDANTLINGANLLANIAGAAGSIVGAIPGYIGLDKALSVSFGHLPPLSTVTDLLDTQLGDTSLGGILGSLADLIPSAERSGLSSNKAAGDTGTVSSSTSNIQKPAGLIMSVQGSPSQRTTSTMVKRP